MKRNKLLSLIISLVAAVALWIYVVTVVNPEGKREISDIPVVFSGQEILREDHRLLIMDAKDQKVSATFHGKNADLNKLLQNQEQLSAVVDVTKIRSDREYKMDYQIVLPSEVPDGSVQVDSRAPSRISFTVEKLVKLPVEIRGDFSAVSVAEGYMLDKASFDMDTITVEGPESIVQTVDCAQVVMNRSNLERTVTETAQLTLLNKDGSPVDVRELTLSDTEVDVTLNVVKYKDVPLAIEILNGGGATEKDVSYTITPSQIILSGDATVLDGINQLYLGTVDLAEMMTNSDTLTLPILLPNDTKNVTGVAEAQVELKIKNKELATLKVDKDSFSFINAPQGLNPVSVTQQLSVTVRADPADIERISGGNCRVVADLTNYTAAGTYTVKEVTIYINGSADAGVIGEYEIVVSLAEPKPEDTKEHG